MIDIEVDALDDQGNMRRLVIQLDDDDTEVIDSELVSGRVGQGVELVGGEGDHRMLSGR